MKFDSFESMCAARRALGAEDATMLVFHVGELVYAAVTEVQASWIRRDRMSSKRGGFLKARIRLHANDKQALRNRAVVLGTLDELTAAYETAYTKARGKKAPRNNGWVYECAVTERLAGQKWEPDNVPFWKAPDVVINGVGYQVKGDGAEWFTEQTLAQAAKEMGW